MKPSIVKLLLIIPSLAFLDWVIMIVVGSVSNIFGANDAFFCSAYCYFGITLLALSFLLVAYIIYAQNFHHKIEA